MKISGIYAPMHNATRYPINDDEYEFGLPTTINKNQDHSKFARITEAQVFSEIEIFKNLGVQSTCLDISERSKFRIIDLVEAI